MTTLTQNPQVPSKLSNVGESVKQGMSSMTSYVQTPIANSLNYPKLAGVIMGSYVVLEVIHHYLLSGYVVPYLASTLALGATATTALLWGGLAVSALGVSYLMYKLFFATPKKIKTITPIETQTVTG